IVFFAKLEKHFVLIVFTCHNFSSLKRQPLTLYNRKWGLCATLQVIAPNLVYRQCEGSELSIPHLTVILCR
ncbi:MAG TPA: hypothetical protein PK230_13380, partial [Chitinophagales bacterium]|nr:hypothetical protein [Chitinophagales bacterium]